MLSNKYLVDDGYLMIGHAVNLRLEDPTVKEICKYYLITGTGRCDNCCATACVGQIWKGKCTLLCVFCVSKISALYAFPDVSLHYRDGDRIILRSSIHLADFFVTAYQPQSATRNEGCCETCGFEMPNHARNICSDCDNMYFQYVRLYRELTCAMNSDIAQGVYRFVLCEVT